MKVLRAEPERDDPDEKDTRVSTPEIKPSQDAEVWKMLQKKVQEAQAAGLKPELGERLEKMLREHVDEFRLSYGQDPPVKVKPLKVTLRAGVAPVKAKCRRV
jgi:hypothetical protein